MDSRQWNGEPEAQHDPGRSDGRPSRWRCLGCAWTGKGYRERTAHEAPGHHVVWRDDPRPSPTTKSAAA